MTDLRIAVRSLIRAPRLALAAIVCIGLGATAVSAVASLLFATLLRPPPFPEAERLVRVWRTDTGGADRVSLAFDDVLDLRREVDAFDRVEAAGRSRFVFVGDDGGRRSEGEAVTAGYFELLGVRPALGRLFSADEHAGRGERVMVIAHPTWGAIFGYAPDIIGRTITTPDGPYTIVGVLPPSFTGTVEDDSGELEYWIPAGQLERTESRAPDNFWVIARLRSEEARAAAERQVAGLGERIAAAYPAERVGTGLRVEPLAENWRAGMREGVWLLLGAASLLLLVAATNVAGLMLARALRRGRELAVRVALGAGRWRTVRTLVIEVGLLALAGGALGLALGPPALRWALTLSPELVPAYVSLDLAPGAVLIATAALAAAALIASVAPVVFGSRIDPIAAIRAGGRGSTGGRGPLRWGRILVAGQIAITTTLVASSGLLLRSYRALGDADLGFRTERMLRVALFVNELDARDGTEVETVRRRARAALDELPAVEAVAQVWPTVPINGAPQVPIAYPGMDSRAAERGERTGHFVVDTAFFRVLDIPTLEGRGFGPDDRADGEPVAVVSESMARRIGGGSAVDRVIEVAGTERRVVGVVGDAAFTGVRAAPHERFVVYTPIEGSTARLTSFAIRTRDMRPSATVPEVRSALAAVAPGSALDWIDPFEVGLGDRYETDRFLLALTGAFSTFALALAGLGLFALLSYTVAQSRVEIGVRQALGASRNRILLETLRRAGMLAGVGAGLGFVLTAAVSGALTGTLYGVGGFDPIAYGAAALTLGTLTLIASVLPARAAAVVQPSVALRDG